jgi:hypothetical protein
MIDYEQNMLTSDELILPLLHKDDHMQDTEHIDAKGEGATMDINGWEITCGECSKWRVKCASTPCEGENTIETK